MHDTLLAWQCECCAMALLVLDVPIKQHSTLKHHHNHPRVAQPQAVRWNCGKLGEVLTPLWSGAGAGRDWKAALPRLYDAVYMATYRQLYARKLGLGTPVGAATAAAPSGTGGDAGGEVEVTEDDKLIAALLAAMASTGADYTNTFRGVMRVDPWAADDGEDAGLAYILSQLATASEAAEVAKPRVPMDQLLRLKQRAETDLRFAGQLEPVMAEMARHEAYEALRKRSDADKAAEDAVTWRAWLAQYRARLRSELPAEATSDARAAWAAARQEVMSKVSGRAGAVVHAPPSHCGTGHRRCADQPQVRAAQLDRPARDRACGGGRLQRGSRRPGAPAGPVRLGRWA